MRNAKEFAEEIRSAVEDELRDSLCSESGSRNVVVLQPDSAAGGVEFDYTLQKNWTKKTTDR